MCQLLNSSNLWNQVSRVKMFQDVWNRKVPRPCQAPPPCDHSKNVFVAKRLRHSLSKGHGLMPRRKISKWCRQICQICIYSIFSIQYLIFNICVMCLLSISWKSLCNSGLAPLATLPEVPIRTIKPVHPPRHCHTSGCFSIRDCWWLDSAANLFCYISPFVNISMF